MSEGPDSLEQSLEQLNENFLASLDEEYGSITNPEEQTVENQAEQAVENPEGEPPDPQEETEDSPEETESPEDSSSESESAPIMPGEDKNLPKVELVPYSGEIAKWPSWYFQLQTYLEAFGISVSALTDPPPADQKEKYSRLKGVLAANLKGEALSVMQSADPPSLKNILKLMRKRFNPQTKTGRLQYLRRLLNDAMKSNQGMAKYIESKREILRDNLENKCTLDEILLIGIISGLPETYVSQVTQLLCKDASLALPSLEQSLLELESSKVALNQKKNEDNTATALTASMKSEVKKEVAAQYGKTGKGAGRQGGPKNSKGNQKGHGKGKGNHKGSKGGHPYQKDNTCWHCGSHFHRRGNCPDWNSGFGKGNNQNQNQNQQQGGKGSGNQGWK
jgi:hypothetical protein